MFLKNRKYLFLAIFFFFVCSQFCFGIDKSFGATKLANGNYEVTPKEIETQRKTLEILLEENKYLKEINSIDKDKFDAIVKLKDDNSQKQIAVYKNALEKNEVLYGKLISNYEKQIENYQAMVKNQDDKYNLMKENSDEWKDLSTKLNATNKLQTYKTNFWKSLSVALGVGLVVVSSK